jgi:Phosphatidylinositol-4-phosphate 5-Kinase
LTAVKSLTYQLYASSHNHLCYRKENNDIYHILDVAAFYKKHPNLCVSDLTKGQKVQVKVSEFDRDIVSKIKQKSGYDDHFFLKSFAPRENHGQMTKFEIGSGKSNSFFFYTANNQFIIKTLKEDELKLLVRKGILDKYYNHVKRHPQSLLARFYGIYTVKIKFMKPISVVVMDNLMGN